MGAQIGGKVVSQEYPTLAELGSRDFAAFGFGPQGLPVHLEVIGGFIEIKGLGSITHRP